MTPKNARIALEFLKRADLKGSEVPAFVDVVQELNTFAAAIPATEAKPAQEPLPPMPRD